MPLYESKAIVSVEGMIGRLRRFTPYIDLVAIEMIQSYWRSVGRSTFTTALVVGRLIQALYDKDYQGQIKLYSRPTIKGALGGCKTDTDVHQALKIRYGEARKGEKLEGVVRDIWSALALAVALEENPNMKTW